MRGVAGFNNGRSVLEENIRRSRVPSADTATRQSTARGTFKLQPQIPQQDMRFATHLHWNSERTNLLAGD